MIMSSDRHTICDSVTTPTGNSSATPSAAAHPGEETRAAVETGGSPPAKKRRTSGGNDPYSTAGCAGVVSSSCANTEASTRWALSNYNLWREDRNARFLGDSENQVPADLLKSTDSKLLNKWLSLYAAETQKQDGGVYPPKTVSHLLSGLSRYMRSLNPTCPNIMDTCNVEFRSLHDLLEKLFRERQTNTSTPEAKPSKRFSKEEEDRLWSTGALSTETPKGLLHAVFVLNGMNFGLVGGEKHRQLKLSQLKRVAHPPRYVYTRYVSENQATDFMSSETVCIDAVVEKGNRCHVHVLDLYLQKLPPEAFKNDVFYLHPVTSFTDPAKLWFTTNPIGREGLNKMIKELHADADVLVGEQCQRASPAQQAQTAAMDPRQVAMIPHALVVQALLEARARELRNITHQPVVIPPTTTNHQQPPVIHTTRPTHNTTPTNAAQEPAVSPSSQTTTNPPQHTTMSVQGVTPHNFTFNNCSVTIFVTPSQSQQESNNM